MMINENILKSDERAVYKLRSLYKSYGYSSFKMSKFEEYDLYLKNKDFLVTDRVITFNEDGRLLALKPDVTLSIIKNTVTSGTKTKVYYNENVYRPSRATGQFKEILQTGLECIGDIDISDVFEVVTLAAKSLSAVSESFVLDLSHMGLLGAILDESGGDASFKREVTRLIADKNAHEAEALCDSFGIAERMKEKIVTLCSMYGAPYVVLERLSPLCETEEQRRAYDELCRISALLESTEESDRIRIDFSVVNDMNYYNGIVFRGFLSGIAEGVLAGGEYGLLMRNMGKNTGAIGFALYLDQLAELEGEKSGYDVDVLILYNNNTDPKALADKKRELIGEGKSVFSERTIPEKLRYKELAEM